MGKRYWLKGLAIGAVAVGLWCLVGESELTGDESTAIDGGQRPKRTEEPAPSGVAPAKAAVAKTAVVKAADAAPPSVPEPGTDPAATYPLNLAVLQQVMPDNVYWAFGAPTSDERVLEARTAAERKRNETFGRIQAGEASEEEIHAYFEAQRRLHQDYFDLSTRILSDYGEELPERDRGLYELGANMHRDRLAELPRLEDEAIERKRTQDERRKAWGGKAR